MGPCLCHNRHCFFVPIDSHEPMTDAYKAILARCHARDLAPNCFNALQCELQEVRQAVKLASMALVQLRVAQQFALQRTSSAVLMDEELLETMQTLQLQLTSA